MSDQTWTVLGVPIDCSGRARGEERAPSVLREAGLVGRLDAKEAGDVDAWMHDPVRDPTSGIIGFATVRDACVRIRDRASQLLDQGERLLVVGGCCTLMPGLMAGVRRARGDAGLAFIDGHLDFYDGKTSDTGEAAEMDLAIMTGHGPKGLIDLAGSPPIIDPGKVVAIGYRDDVVRHRLGAVDPADALPGIRLIHGRELLENNPREIGRNSVDFLSTDGRPYWLHLDLDVLDQASFPAVTYPQAEGPGWDQLAALLEPLLGPATLIGMNVTDYNPDRDPDREFADAVVRFLGECLGSAN